MRGGKVHLTTFIRRALGRAPSTSLWHDPEPISEVLFSVERLEEHARSLALAQPVTPKSTKGHPLAGRLADNAATLLHAYRNIAQTIDEGRAITPAARPKMSRYFFMAQALHLRPLRLSLPDEKDVKDLYFKLGSQVSRPARGIGDWLLPIGYPGSGHS